MALASCVSLIHNLSCCLLMIQNSQVALLHRLFQLTIYWWQQNSHYHLKLLFKLVNSCWTFPVYLMMIAKLSELVVCHGSFQYTILLFTDDSTNSQVVLLDLSKTTLVSTDDSKSFMWCFFMGLSVTNFTIFWW